ncbi:MAG: metalloregulator ArsR/SmtB family transcription factor [Desulfosarcinaceae bacterium]|nr:metalloregulator ArsR/SmtB family transcription factor [Desulfosarcinaceae bacterium]
MLDFMNITRALSDENRVRIVAALQDRELCVCQIIDMLQLSPSTVSKHLSILRNARLLIGRKEGRWMHYRLCDDDGRPMVSDAIAWVLRSIAADPQIQRDRDYLKTVPTDPAAMRCG